MGTRVRKAAGRGGLDANWSCVVSCASDLCVCVWGGGGCMPSIPPKPSLSPSPSPYTQPTHIQVSNAAIKSTLRLCPPESLPASWQQESADTRAKRSKPLILRKLVL